MNSDLAYKKNVRVKYVIASFLLVGLSCFSLLFKEWVLIPSMAFCAIIGYLVLVLFLNSKINSEDDSTKLKFLGTSAIRYILMAIGLVAAGLLVYFTMKDGDTNKRYIMVAIAALPYFLPSLSMVLTKYE